MAKMATSLLGPSFFSFACIFFALLASLGAAHPRPVGSRAAVPHALPEPLALGNRGAGLSTRDVDGLIRPGGWLISYQPEGSEQHYDGTLRVQGNETHLIVSGDLYERTKEPNPAGGIPIFPADSHYSYIRVTGYSQQSSGFNLNFQLWLGQGMDEEGALQWQYPEDDIVYSANMTRCTAPEGFPSANDYLKGDMTLQDGTLTGQFTMGWISEMFRKFTLEIDSIPGVKLPLDNGRGEDWASTFAKFGYEVTVDVSDNTVEKTNTSEFWAEPDMHEAMHKYRQPVDFDSEWRIYLLVVEKIWETDRGIMFDSNADTDPNSKPREGAAISAGWIVGTSGPDGLEDGSDWGEEQGKRFDESTAGYFRASVHEVLHAFGQYHATSMFEREFTMCSTFDFGYMTTSEAIAECGREAKEAGTGPGYPDNIKWDLHETQKLWMGHLSDQHVRPGYADFQGLSFRPPENPSNLIGSWLTKRNNLFKEQC